MVQKVPVLLATFAITSLLRRLESLMPVGVVIWGALVFSGTATWNAEFGSSAQTGAIQPAYGIIPCCVSILVLVVPLLLWVFLVRGKKDNLA